MVGLEGEAGDGGEHGDARGLVDVDAVDGLGVDLGDGDGEGDAADAAVELFALFAGELFGVFEAGAGEGVGAFGQDDGGGDDGAEERAAADLVDAGDGAEAAIAEGLLGCVGADEELQHALLGGGGGDGMICCAAFAAAWFGAVSCCGRAAHSGYESTTFVNVHPALGLWKAMYSLGA